MILLVYIIISIIAITGMYVCYAQIKKDLIFCYGIWFFALVVFYYLIKITIHFIPLNLFLRGVGMSYTNIGMVISGIQIFNSLILFTAFIILIVGFSRCKNSL
ncbi:hypothetical protein E308F_27800 [Moorella sp. E308F]|jgi:hypothetical protein|nr:hypothetical protein E308F_27800 [Moorella sp. E308F]